jgi:FkbM family methyltransferase
MSPRSILQSAIQKSLATAGFEIHRKRRANSAFPFVQKAEMPGVAFQYWVADEIAEAWYRPEGLRKLAEVGEIKHLIQPGDRVLEIGSHHGIFMLILSRLVGSEGLVVSVEPHPFNAMVANAQIALNQLHNCRLIQAAASDRPGILQLSNDSNGSIVRSEGIQVPAITGDELDAQFGPFTVLKIDVEGYEAVVLDGCRKILSRAPRISIEVHSPVLPSFGVTVNQVLERIPERYHGTMILRSDWAVQPFCRESLPPDHIANLFLRPRDGPLAD